MLEVAYHQVINTVSKLQRWPTSLQTAAGGHTMGGGALPCAAKRGPLVESGVQELWVYTLMATPVNCRALGKLHNL